MTGVGDGAVVVEATDDGPTIAPEAVDLDRWRPAAGVLAGRGVAGPAELPGVRGRGHHGHALNAEHLAATGPPTCCRSHSTPSPTRSSTGGAAPAGDVVICPPWPPARPERPTGCADEAELALLVVHGVLTCSAWTTPSPDEQAAMVRESASVLAAVGLERRP